MLQEGSYWKKNNKIKWQWTGQSDKSNQGPHIASPLLASPPRCAWVMKWNYTHWLSSCFPEWWGRCRRCSARWFSSGKWQSSPDGSAVLSLAEWVDVCQRRQALRLMTGLAVLKHWKLPLFLFSHQGILRFWREKKCQTVKLLRSHSWVVVPVSVQPSAPISYNPCSPFALSATAALMDEEEELLSSHGDVGEKNGRGGG